MTGKYDLVIRNVSVFDGNGGEAVQADVAVSSDRIAEVGSLNGVDSMEEIDGAGLSLAPGFIDVHTHDDRALLDSAMSAKTSQGVTSVVVGNCGVSMAPLTLSGPPVPPMDLLGTREQYAYPTFADYLATLRSAGTAVNAASLCGHTTLRAGAMDDLTRPATASEIEVMRGHLDEAMRSGAIGFSTGLAYPPAMPAPREEVESLAEVCARYGGIHTTHIRDESENMIDALDEAFQIGRSASMPVLVSHFKCSGTANYGKSAERLAHFDRAAAKQDLSVDAYPYAASSTILNPDFIAEAERVMITWSVPHPDMRGRDLADIASEWGVEQGEAAERLQPAGAVYFAMDENDVRRILQHTDTMIGSDGLPHDSHPHPRLWGTFPRVLGHYARDVGLFPMGEAVRRMTSLPAKRFGLKDRGEIRPGGYADLVLFDAEAIVDSATFENPMTPAAGIHGVWVNGGAVWRHGKSTGNRPGAVLERQTA